MKIYFFYSSNSTDKCSVVTILSKSVRRAYSIAILKFKEWGYKGTPIRLAV